MASDNMKRRRLQELGESDFEIVDGQPDIRGWDVKNEKNQKIGEVEELILDAQKRRVRYMVVDLDDNDFDIDDKEVLIPIGMAELHKDDDDVIIQNLTPDQLRALPEYDEDHLTPEVERSICSSLGRTGLSSTSQSSSIDEMDSTFYEHDHFNDKNLYRRRLPMASTGTLQNSGVGDSGYGLRDRIGHSGSEVGGYKGSGDTSYDRERAGRGIESGASVPVNRDRNDPDDISRTRETNIDNLTGDNNRGIDEDDIARGDEPRRV
jgi:sporulation protein YlmC with PRC-barrel domain